ncbi:unnamed protein product [Calicophoron daubneyi]|uniref:PDZ domain-containing protein n=1 Tax=Calicophoron daubneyi TaxID=300641 RepID=A0AAV2TNX4_CALDB
MSQKYNVITVPDPSRAHRPERSRGNGVFVTSDDLSEPYRPGSSLYVKPLHSEESSTSDVEKRLPQPSRNNSSLIVDHVSNRTGRYSPSLAQIGRSSFKRNTAARRSLGAIAIPSFWSDDSPLSQYENPENVDPPAPEIMDPGSVSVTTNSGNRRFECGYDSSPLLRIRVVRLASLDELGFALDSYSDPESGQFIGLRLCERFPSRNFHSDARDNCLFQSGDLIVSVNEHKLASMHESQAIRYVYNAFRDARQYAVEFGVRRPSVDSREAYPQRTYEVSTLPTRFAGPVSRRSTPLQLGSDTEKSYQIPDQHRPRRRTQTLAASSDISLPSRSGQPADYTNLNSQFTNDGCGSSPPTPTAVSSKSFRTTPSSSTLDNQKRGRLELNAFNTRTIGQKINIDLVKEFQNGLGFTLTSRDTQTTCMREDEPVYVKKILACGPAFKDGRLLIGDRLLSVNGTEAKNLEHVLSLIRSVRPGHTVHLVVSRQEGAAAELGSGVSKSSTDNTVSEGNNLPPRPFRVFTYEYNVPSVNDTRGDVKPSLGVNFKWATQPSEVSSSAFSSRRSYAPAPGLYVDSLLDDGLVTLGNRHTLQAGDRLVGVNGQSLEGLKAKSVVSILKDVLSSFERSDRGPSSQIFSLTIHRYSAEDEEDEEESRGRKSTRPVNTITIEDRTNSTLKRGDDVSNSDSSVRIQPVPTDLRRRSSVHIRQITRDLSDGDSDQGDDGSSDVDLGDMVDHFSRRSSGSVASRYQSVPPRGSSGMIRFDREGFARRSVSEKRHAHVDATQYAFYQNQILPSRYKMPEEVDKQYSTMPTARRLKMHRERMAAAAALAGGYGPAGPVKAVYTTDFGLPESSEFNPSKPTSGAVCQLPSLRPDTPRSSTPTSGRFRRGRKQNNSFRHAVDRSLTSASVEPPGHERRDAPKSRESLLDGTRPPARLSDHNPTNPASLSFTPVERRPSSVYTFSPSPVSAPIHLSQSYVGPTKIGSPPLDRHVDQRPPSLPDASTTLNGAPPIPSRRRHPPSSPSVKKSGFEKSDKGGFGSLRDLFRRASTKSESRKSRFPETYTPKTEDALDEIPALCRLSVPDSRPGSDTSALHHTVHSISHFEFNRRDLYDHSEKNGRVPSGTGGCDMKSSVSRHPELSLSSRRSDTPYSQSTLQKTDRRGPSLVPAQKCRQPHHTTKSASVTPAGMNKVAEWCAQLPSPPSASNETAVAPPIPPRVHSAKGGVVSSDPVERAGRIKLISPTSSTVKTDHRSTHLSSHRRKSNPTSQHPPNYIRSHNPETNHCPTNFTMVYRDFSDQVGKSTVGTVIHNHQHHHDRRKETRISHSRAQNDSINSSSNSNDTEDKSVQSRKHAHYPSEHRRTSQPPSSEPKTPTNESRSRKKLQVVARPSSDTSSSNPSRKRLVEKAVDFGSGRTSTRLLPVAHEQALRVSQLSRTSSPPKRDRC